MKLFDLIRVLEPAFKEADAKVHLATHNGYEDPLDVFIAGKFPEWQCAQNNQNFKCRYVVALIAMPGRGKWLFAGLFTVDGDPVEKPNPLLEGKRYFEYPMSEVASVSGLTGRLVVEYTRRGQQPYLRAEKMHAVPVMTEFYAQRLSIGDFPGFRSVDITFDELRLLTLHKVESWRSALQSVAGVYVISDTKSKKLYVGSASGAEGIWGRWQAYAATGHGGNKQLKALIEANGFERANPFRFAILEIADIHTSFDDILQRESHWMRVLLTRDGGLNARELGV